MAPPASCRLHTPDFGFINHLDHPGHALGHCLGVLGIFDVLDVAPEANDALGGRDTQVEMRGRGILA